MTTEASAPTKKSKSGVAADFKDCKDLFIDGEIGVFTDFDAIVSLVEKQMKPKDSSALQTSRSLTSKTQVAGPKDVNMKEPEWATMFFHKAFALASA